MYKILLVEDDPVIAAEVQRHLRQWDYEVVCAEDFKNVMGTFAGCRPHLVILDILLPYYNGFYWCTQIRREHNVPILFLSSACDNMNIVMAMNMGGDDFIAKPFDQGVLIAKVQAMLRRTYDFASTVSVLEYKGSILNTGDQTMTYDGEQISLSKNEYRIWLTLLEHKGSVVSREKLMETLWKTDDYIDENTLTVNINRLRKKLEAAGLKNAIETKFGVGYLVE